MVCDRIKPGIKDDPLVVERVDEAIREGYEEITLGSKEIPWTIIYPLLMQC